MPLEETAAGSRRAALSYSPSRSPASSRIYGAAGASSSQRRTAQGAFSMRPPEPLRRAVADCLSSSASSSSAVAVSGAPHVLQGYPSGNASDATRLLRDYIASPSTTDMAYSVLVEHALAERDRSPAVVPKCVALLKRYLMRYVPGLQILRQIDLFCVNLIVECESVTSQSVSLRSSSLSQQYGTSLSSTALLPSPLASNYASPSLVKSLNYVRSLVARHTPMLSFQPSAIEASTALKQSLPSLSSLLSRSFSSQLGTEVSGRTTLKLKEDSIPSTSKISSLEEVNTREGNKYIFFDLLKWRWPGNKEYQTALLRESNSLRLEDVHNYGFLETGAATLLIADLESKVKSQPSKYRADDIPDIGLLQPSMATMATDYTSADSHLKAITAAKRMKLGPQQVWANIPVSTFYPRARPLFQYRHYSEQQPLKLNFAEIREVIAEVCSESSSHITSQLSTPKIIGNSGQPASDVAASVLIKLVIDMYVMDRGTAAPLTLYMLEGMISSGRALSRARAFDFILNLGIHAQLLEPMLPEDPPHESLQETDLNSEEQLSTTKKVNTESNIQERIASAIDKFESWILVILYEMLILLVQTEEREEIVWASALSCLFFFVCDRGQILRNRLDGLDIRVVKTLLEVSREHSWAEIIHCKLICMLTNMFYQSSEGPGIALSETPTFVSKQVDLLGGIDFICLEYSRANTREEKHNLFLVLLDYVSYQINESCLANEASGYDDDEIQTIVSMLIRAGAPGAFYISVKSGLEGIGDIFKKSISSTLLRFPNCDNLKLLLEKITGKLDSTLSAFTRLDHEFSYMIRVTKSVKSFPRINNKVGEADDLMEAKLSFATLHSLLHSERSAYRHHGYIWLVELILSEINDNRNGSIWSSMTNFQQQILVAGSQDSPYLEVPFSISMMCGLLKSKSNFIRWGFLYVLEKVLIRCKLFLDESDLQYLDPEGVVNRKADIQIDKANAIIDIMNAALSLVVQMNETDHINILKMCEILFTQLCFKLQSSPEVPFEDFKISHLFDCASESCRYEHEAHFSVEATERKSLQGDKLPESVQIHHGTDQSNTICETASMAALLLRGQAIAPMQLATRVPASLFYWPLIQLAGAATDDIALGVAVGSKGRGNLPGATSDIRAALLLLLIGKCTADPEAFMEIEGKEFFRGLLDDTDSRVAYYSAAFLLKRMMSEEPETYQRMLQNLIIKAQQCNNEKLLENPYLQMRGILQLSNDIGAQI